MLLSDMEHKNELEASVRNMSPERQFRTFLRSLFVADDLVEIRAITSSSNDTGSLGRVVHRSWHKAIELEDEFEKLLALNQQGANIYFGVNPRVSHHGNKQSVRMCRVLWADLDHCSLVDAAKHWQGEIPEPSIVVNSGHGIHLYWKLQSAVNVREEQARSELEALLKALYKDLDSDSTQDVTRLLRLPGFSNTKSEHVPCVMERFNASRVHPISAFEAWRGTLDSAAIEKLTDQFSTSQFSSQRSHDVARIRGLVSSLDRDVADRSKRDFGVVCRLLELGLAPTDVQSLVFGKSKFTTEQYTQRTLKNAMRAILGQ